MFERYTESASRSLFFARFEASWLGAGAIDTEHLLLGLIHNGGLDAIVPAPLDGARRDLSARIVSLDMTAESAEIPFTAEAQQALQFAEQEADALGHAHIGSEHVLLGLLHDEQSVACRTLVAHGVRLGDVRRSVAALRGSLEGSPRSIRRFHVKMLVQELAQTSPGPQAELLVRQILAGLDDIAT